MNEQAPIYHIYVPASRSFLVTRDYQMVSNWRELQDEARAVVEAAIKERWTAHWQRVTQIAAQAQAAEKLEDLMPIILPPDMYYPCPPDLAAKAQPQSQKSQCAGGIGEVFAHLKQVKVVLEEWEKQESQSGQQL